MSYTLGLRVDQYAARFLVFECIPRPATCKILHLHGRKKLSQGLTKKVLNCEAPRPLAGAQQSRTSFVGAALYPEGYRPVVREVHVHRRAEFARGHFVTEVVP